MMLSQRNLARSSSAKHPAVTSQVATDNAETPIAACAFFANVAMRTRPEVGSSGQ